MQILTQLTHDYAQQVMNLGEEFFHESRFFPEEFDRKSVWGVFQKTVTHPQEFFLAFAVEEEQVVGFILMAVGKRYFTKTCYATDLAVYIKKAYRGRHLFPQLVKAVERWAAVIKVTCIYLSISSGISDARTEKIYSHYGYNNISKTFVKELK